MSHKKCRYANFQERRLTYFATLEPCKLFQLGWQKLNYLHVAVAVAILRYTTLTLKDRWIYLDSHYYDHRNYRMRNVHSGIMTIIIGLFLRLPEPGARPTHSQFQSLKIRRSANFMQFGNVDTRILALKSCGCVGREKKKKKMGCRSREQ